MQIWTILGSKIQTCMCHNPDNFEPLAKVCTGVQTILVGEPSSIIGSGVGRCNLRLRGSPNEGGGILIYQLMVGTGRLKQVTTAD